MMLGRASACAAAAGALNAPPAIAMAAAAATRTAGTSNDRARVLAIAHLEMKGSRPALSNERLPVRERTIGPPMGRARGRFGHRLDERECFSSTLTPRPGRSLGHTFPFLQSRNSGM